MLEQLLKHLKNWFRVHNDVDGIYSRTYIVESGGVVLPFLQDGQYFRIIGSVFNDGLYIYGETILDGDGNEAKLTDETFTGTVWALAIPKAVIDMAVEIGQWVTKYGKTAESPYTSESFGGYSYTKATGNGAETGWEAAFSTRLNQWRKLMED